MTSIEPPIVNEDELAELFQNVAVSVPESAEQIIKIIDFIFERKRRQTINDLIVLNAILLRDEVSLRKCCNNNALNRLLNGDPPLEVRDDEDEVPVVLALFGLHTIDQVFDSCSNCVVSQRAVSTLISIKASRQGSLDEALQLETCNKVSSEVGIHIKNLGNHDFRALQTSSEIFSGTEFKKSKIKKENFLKSFDGKITGKINGWIYAKVRIGSGGHQDNVSKESHGFLEWAHKHGNPDDYHIALIDTDKEKWINGLKDDFHRDKVLVVSHIEFQEWILEKFGNK